VIYMGYKIQKRKGSRLTCVMVNERQEVNAIFVGFLEQLADWKNKLK
jgi:hypothetical protein